MSREILFRGKNADNGEWISGFYFQRQNPLTKDGLPIYHGIADLPPFGAEVIPETVGQFTGLTDNNRKNKKKIFEGDIVKAYFNFNPTDFVIGKVIFEYGTFKIRVTGTKKKGEFSKFTDDNIKAYAIENNFIDRGYLLEVIGNIHDNPELLN